MSLTKTFITEFKKQVFAVPKEINDSILSQKERIINDSLIISGYCSSGKNLLYIILTGRKAIPSISACERYINESESLCSEHILNNYDKIYWLIYKNKTTYLMFEYNVKEEWEEVKPLINKPLSILKNIFNDADNEETMMGDGDLKGNLVNVINDIWNKTNMSGDNRTLLINVIWILLHDNDNKFISHPKWGSYSLMEYLKILNDSLTIRYDFDSPEQEKLRNLSDCFNDKVIDEQNNSQHDNILFKAFKRSYMNRIKKHSRNGNESLMETESKRAFDTVNKAFEELIANKNVSKMLVEICNTIYIKIYCFNSKLNLNKYIFEYKWTNFNTTRARTAGIVHTPEFVKNNLINLIFKNKYDEKMKRNELITFYDPTCGTGGFTTAFKDYCENANYENVIIYNNEISSEQQKYALIEGICSNLDIRSYNRDCFDPIIKHELIPQNSIDFLFMNPPYGLGPRTFDSSFDWHEDVNRTFDKMNQSELSFCRYNMESFSKQGGWFVWLIPTSKISENSQWMYDKERILDECEIWYLIKLNPKMFREGGVGNLPTVLIVGRYLNGISCGRSKEMKDNWSTKVVDLTDYDGKMMNGQLVYDLVKFEKLVNERVLNDKCLNGMCVMNFNDNVNNDDVMNVNINKSLNDNSFNNHSTNDSFNHEYSYEIHLTPEINWCEEPKKEWDFEEFRNEIISVLSNRLAEILAQNVQKLSLEAYFPTDENLEMKEIKFTDMFEYIGRGKCKANNNEKGEYPLVSASTKNNGIIKYINIYSFGHDENDLNITVAVDGNGAGTCFVQKGKFDCVADVCVIKLKDEWNEKINNEEHMNILVQLMTSQFTKRYNWSYKLNQQRLKDESLMIPFDKRTNEVNFDLLHVEDFSMENVINMIYRETKMSDLFELMPKGKKHAYGNLPEGEYPFISNSKYNNGIKCYVNYYDYNGTYLTISSDAETVSCFVQRGKFAVQNIVSVLKLKPKYEYLIDDNVIDSLALVITIELRKKYNLINRLNEYRLMRESLHFIPYCVNPKNNDEIIIDASGLRYIYLYNVIPDYTKEHHILMTYVHNGIVELPTGIMMKEVRIDELFEYYEKGKVSSLSKHENGPYPCISCTKSNNGIAKYIDKYDYDTDELGFPLITVPGDGDIHKCFVQVGKFSAQTSVHVLKLKDEQLNKCIGLLSFIMSLRFGDGTYEYHKRKLNKERLMNETIMLPVVVRGLSEDDLIDHSIYELTNDGKSDKYKYEVNMNLLNTFFRDCLTTNYA